VCLYEWTDIWWEYTQNVYVIFYNVISFNVILQYRNIVISQYCYIAISLYRNIISLYRIQYNDITIYRYIVYDISLYCIQYNDSIYGIQHYSCTIQQKISECTYCWQLRLNGSDFLKREKKVLAFPVSLAERNPTQQFP
jgi:hypothetical protein